MAISTFSKFYYGHTITQDNRLIDYNEGAGDNVATLNIGNYSLSEFITEVTRAMNDSAVTNEYTITVDRTTRQLSILGDAGSTAFLFGTGTNVSNSASELMGFDVADVPTANPVVSPNGSGEEYIPQFLLQTFMPFNHIIQSVQSKVNEAASGEIEVVNFGRVNMMKCNIDYITDIAQPLDAPITNNQTGVDDAINFLTYITTKAKIEFIPDIDAPSDFTKCLCQKTKSDSNGTGFELQELLGRGLANYYQTGILTFRKVS